MHALLQPFSLMRKYSALGAYRWPDGVCDA
jgi:hypothetical protein